jgi:NTP pyrophosphatase (non-canonical NTP hydrolase)
MINIKDFVKEVGENAIAHGWWDGEERSFGELIALCHSELSEALEEYREGTPLKKLNRDAFSTYYSGGGYVSSQPSEISKKPEGIPSELADVIIRIFDMCHHYGIDIESMLLEKHEFNKSRPYKHGGKII